MTHKLEIELEHGVASYFLKLSVINERKNGCHKSRQKVAGEC